MKKFIYFNLHSFGNKEEVISKDETIVEALPKKDSKFNNL